MLAEDAAKIIREMLGEQITFSKHFNKVFNSLKETRQEQLISWVKECQEGKSFVISSDRVTDLLGFVLRFRDTNFRAILTKKKNEYFLNLFLDKHKYYELERRKLGI